MNWIPLINNVPNEGTYVLVSLENRYVNIAFYRLGRFMVDMKQVYPDAWMPLPVPYRISRHEQGYHAHMARIRKLAKYGVIKC